MERRIFIRFQARDDAYAAIRGDFRTAGRICDISLNGLAFRYFAEKMCKEAFCRVDIFLSNSAFHLPDIPCTVVYDVKEPISSSYSLSQFKCGLEFRGIEEREQHKLKVFINNYTTGALKSETMP